MAKRNLYRQMIYTINKNLTEIIDKRAFRDSTLICVN